MSAPSSTAKVSGSNESDVKKFEEVNRPLCFICHDRSSGFHYGTHACEGCKGFFRRMVINAILVQSMLQCTGAYKYHCDVNSVTRNNCQRCRLQKCFQMGMTRHKTRLGRRNKATVDATDFCDNTNSIIDILTDEEMARYIKRESRYFSTNDTDEDEPLGECIKHKAKLYSEKNSKSYQTYLTNQMKESIVCSDQVVKVHCQSAEPTCAKNVSTEEDNYRDRLTTPTSDRNDDIACFGNAKKYFGISNLETGESRAMDFTEHFLNSLSPTLNNLVSDSNISDSPHMSCQQMLDVVQTSEYSNKSSMFESIRMNTKKLQIDKMCIKIRLFLSHDLSRENSRKLDNYKRIISSLNRHFFAPSMDEIDKFCRIKLSSVKCCNNPQIVYNELRTKMIDMCKNILDFFKEVPDLELAQISAVESGIIRKKIAQTLAIFMIKLVNVSENMLYDPLLSKKIPFSILTQTPLRHFFETLLHLADISKSILTLEIDDTELSFLSLLIITFPKKGFIHCSESMLQPDHFLKVRFLYSALLYEYIHTEKCQKNSDNTEIRFQKLCWLINQSHLLQENDVNFMFAYLKI